MSFRQLYWTTNWQFRGQRITSIARHMKKKTWDRKLQTHESNTTIPERRSVSHKLNNSLPVFWNLNIILQGIFIHQTSLSHSIHTEFCKLLIECFVHPQQLVLLYGGHLLSYCVMFSVDRSVASCSEMQNKVTTYAWLSSSDMSHIYIYLHNKNPVTVDSLSRFHSYRKLLLHIH